MFGHKHSDSYRYCDKYDYHLRYLHRNYQIKKQPFGLILGDEMNQTRQAMMPREGLQQENV
jgi:hypothetical protein